MEDLSACRVCLATDVKLVEFYQYPMIEMYELLTGSKFQLSSGLPRHICTLCQALMRKCVLFQQRCLTSYQFLCCAANEETITTSYLRDLDKTALKLSHPYQIHHNNKIMIKDELIEEENIINFTETNNLLEKNDGIDNLIVKDESYENSILLNDFFDETNNFSSDEEPLSIIVKKKRKKKEICQKRKNIKTENATNKNIDIKIDIKNELGETNDLSIITEENKDNVLNKIPKKSVAENNSYKKSKNTKKFSANKTKSKYNTKVTKDLAYLMKNDIDIVYLSKEQQIQEIQSRKTSQNYTMSQFKCEHCNKGYLTEETYQNHVGIHDPSRGSYVCDICHSTYDSSRSLCSHKNNNHTRNFVCKKCNSVFKSCNKAKEHVKWHEGVTFDCQLCDASFRKRTTYMTHVRLRHYSGVACELCGDNFSGLYGLNQHVKKSHRGKQISSSLDTTCEHCKIKFKHVEALQRHKEVANGAACDNTVQHCHMCGESFASHYALGQHMDSHKTVKLYTCQQCSKVYLSSQAYKYHYHKHHAAQRILAQPKPTTNRPLVCEHCGIKCSNKYVLVNHIRSHTGEKPYECTLCPKRFTLPQRLQIHMRTHTGERPFQCSVCPKAFTHKAGLNRHTAVHTGAKPYTCLHCQKSFSQSNSLKIHIRTVHLKQPAPYRRSNKSHNAEYCLIGETG